MRKLVIPTLAAIAALVVLLNLGFWQLDRLAWKENLIEQVEAGVSTRRKQHPTLGPGATLPPLTTIAMSGSPDVSWKGRSSITPR